MKWAFVELRSGHAEANATAAVDGPMMARHVRDAEYTHVHVLDHGAGMANWPVLAGLIGHALTVRYEGDTRRLTPIQQLIELGVQEIVVPADVDPIWLHEALLLFPGRLSMRLTATTASAAPGLVALIWDGAQWHPADAVGSRTHRVSAHDDWQSRGAAGDIHTAWAPAHS